MYEELVRKLRSHNGWALNETLDQAAEAIEELQQTAQHYHGSADDWYQTACDYVADNKALKEDYAAMLKLHNTTAQMARSEECAQRVERRQMSEAEREHLARRTGLLEEWE